MRACFLIVVVLLSSVGFAEEVDLQALAADLRAMKDHKIKDAEFALEALKKRRLSAAEKNRERKILESQLVHLRSQPIELPELDSSDLTDGDVGILKNEVEVLQVIGDDKLLVEPIEHRAVGSVGGPFATPVIRSVETRGDLFIIRGHPTNGVADGKEMTFSDLFHVAGTESYTTVTGASKTVFVLEKIDKGALLAILNAPAAPETRSWTDASGKFKVEASFQAYKEGNVTILKADGKEVTLPLSKLSEADQRWVRDELKRR